MTDKMFLFFKMVHFALRNEPFCSLKWTVLLAKKGRFEVQNGPFCEPLFCKENSSPLFSVV